MAVRTETIFSKAHTYLGAKKDLDTARLASVAALEDEEKLSKTLQVAGFGKLRKDKGRRHKART